MMKPNRDLRVILIGGSSHVGKSTLARVLSSRLRWSRLSTDSLARHPGRPWSIEPRKVPEDVAEHYLSLSTNDLIIGVLNHYKNLWPDIEALIAWHATDPAADRLVLEGSVLWPESVATLAIDGVAAFWLTASSDLFQARIYKDSRYEDASDRQKAMIAKFLERTLSYDKRMMHAVNRLGRVSLEVEQSSSPEDLSRMVLERFDDSFEGSSTPLRRALPFRRRSVR